MNGWTTIALQRDLGEYTAAWDRLNRELFNDHPLSSSLFVNGMLRQFGSGAEYLCIYRENGVETAMCIVRRRKPMVWISFLPSQAQIAPTLVGDPAPLASLVGSLPGFAVQLDMMCNDPAFGGVLDGAARRHLRNHALTMKIDLRGTFADYWASRSKQLQSNVKQRDRRLAEAGHNKRVVKITDPAEMLAAVDRYAALECAGWKGLNATAVGSTPEQHQFYRDLMLGAASEGNAFVFELWFGEQLAASRLLVRRNRMWVILKTSYNEGLGAFAPGRMLLCAVIDDAFRTEPEGKIEFYTDADETQLEWATSQRWIQHRTFHRHRVSEGLGVAMRAARRQSADAGDKTVEVVLHPDALPDDVQRCLAKAEKRNVGFGLAWYRNLVATVYPDHAGIRIYVLRDSKGILAIVPVRAGRIRNGWRVHALSNFYTSLYEPFMQPGLKAHALVPVLAAMQRDLPGLASLTMAPMDPASDAYQALLGAMQIKGWVPFEYFSFGNWYQRITSGWAPYLAERHGTLQSTIRRMGKKFAGQQGKLELITSPKQLERGIAAYEQVYNSSWKRMEPFPAFMPGLMKVYAEKGMLRLGVAWLNDQPVAAQVWIVSHGRAEIYKLAYDEAFAAYSPGTLLSALLMEHVLDVDKVAEVDYLIGDDPYKKTWVSQRRERWGLVAYNPRSLQGIAGLIKETAGRVIKRLRERRAIPSAPAN